MLMQSLRLILLGALATSVQASNETFELTDDYKLYKSDPVRYYQTHLAVSNNAKCFGFQTLGRDLVQLLGEYLDADNLGRFLQLNHEINALLKPILIKKLPLIYTSLRQRYEEVFAKVDHPDWKPGDLPDDIKIKLHYGWYYKAMKMDRLVEQTPVDVRKPGDTLKQFKLFYQAGCLGHMLAAERAGLMLLDVGLNNIIPAVITYDDLDPDARKWDVIRLNREFLDPKFKVIWEKMRGVYNFDHYEHDYETVLGNFDSACLYLKGDGIHNSLERKALKMCARAMDPRSKAGMQRLSEHKVSRVGPNLLNYLEKIKTDPSVNIEYLQVFAAHDTIDERDVNLMKRLDLWYITNMIINFYQRFLNHETMMMRSIIYQNQYIDFEYSMNAVSYIFKRGEAAEESFFAQRQCRYVAHLLGDNDYTEENRFQAFEMIRLYRAAPSGAEVGDNHLDKELDAIEYQRIRLAHLGIRTFLGHLSVTRSPSENWMLDTRGGQFKGQKLFIDRSYTDQHQFKLLTNLDRFEMIKKYYDEGLLTFCYRSVSYHFFSAAKYIKGRFIE
jgi:hypothetical protein